MIGTNNTGHRGRPMVEHGDAVYSSTAGETATGVTEIVKVLKERATGEGTDGGVS
jgi:hypothetical protein